jgi:hypothetical protein
MFTCSNFLLLFAGERLAADWDGDKVGLVGEVDCTSNFGKLTCEILEVDSFPTLLYGDPSNMKEYEGGRTYESLSAFAKENLVPRCSAANVDLCDDETKEKIKSYESMSLDKLGSLIMVEEEKINAAREEYENELKSLQEMYDDAAQAKADAIAEVRDGDLPLMNAIHKAKRKAKNGDEL